MQKVTSNLFLFLSLFLLFISGACNNGNGSENVRSDRKTGFIQQVAEKYGYSQWDLVDTIRFTYVVKRQDTIQKRSWQWIPAENKVTYIPYELKGNPLDTLIKENDTLTRITYETTQWSRDDYHLIAIDRHFVHDRFWLLFPFYLMWDNPDITLRDSVQAPISKNMSTLLIAKYNGDGNSQEDVYEVYINDRDLIEEWVFKLRGNARISLATTWEEHQDYGPLTLSTRHRNAMKTFEIKFEDIEVITGKDSLATPDPEVQESSME